MLKKISHKKNEVLENEFFADVRPRMISMLDLNIINMLRFVIITISNPECKTYQECLEKELLMEDCLAYDCDLKQWYKTIKNHGATGNYLNVVSVLNITDNDYYKVEQFNNYHKNNLDIYGLPLTFDRVNLAIAKANSNRIAKNLYPYNTMMIHWKPNNNLETQELKTIKTICNILAPLYEVLCK